MCGVPLLVEDKGRGVTLSIKVVHTSIKIAPLVFNDSILSITYYLNMHGSNQRDD